MSACDFGCTASHSVAKRRFGQQAQERPCQPRRVSWPVDQSRTGRHNQSDRLRICGRYHGSAGAQYLQQCPRPRIGAQHYQIRGRHDVGPCASGGIAECVHACPDPLCERAPNDSGAVYAGPKEDELRITAPPHRGERGGQLFGL